MSFDQEFLDEVNQLRRNPKKYADKINGYLQYFDGKVLNLPGRKAGIQTHEGPKAYNEAVNYLSRQNPVEPLNPSRALFRVAQDYIKKIQRKNADSGGVDIDALIDKYGTYYGDFVNATDYGGLTPEQSIINLIVSDGDFNRVQREQLLSSSYKLIGGATGTHPIFKNCTCIFMCSEFENKKDKEDIGFLDGSSYNIDGPALSKSKSQSQYQPQKKEEPKTKSRYQPKYQSTKREEPQTQSRYQPKYQSTKREEPQTQSRYQPKYQSTKREEPQTQSRYQPKFSYKKEEPQTQSKYQPKFSYKKDVPQTQSKYQPKFNFQKKEEPQTQSRYQSKYQPKTEEKNARYQSKYQPQTRAQPRVTREETTYQTSKKWIPTKPGEQQKADKGKKVIKENSETRILMEGGKKIIETKIVRVYADGTKDEETMIEEE